MRKDKAQKAIQHNEDLKKSFTTQGPYDNVVIYLTKDDGQVLVKGSMKYSDILAMQNLHAALPHEVVGMLFSALEDELKDKNYAKSKINNTQGPATEDFLTSDK